MGLKSCIDCGKTSHTDVNQCVYCGSSKFQTKDLLDSAWLIFVIFSILVALTFFYGNRMLNQLNVGVISAKDFKNCTNDRIKTSMRKSFEEGSAALEKQLIVKNIEAKQIKASKKDILIACEVELQLNNNKVESYIYEIKYIHGEYSFDYHPKL